MLAPFCCRDHFECRCKYGNCKYTHPAWNAPERPTKRPTKRHEPRVVSWTGEWVCECGFENTRFQKCITCYSPQPCW